MGGGTEACALQFSLWRRWSVGGRPEMTRKSAAAAAVEVLGSCR